MLLVLISKVIIANILVALLLLSFVGLIGDDVISPLNAKRNCNVESPSFSADIFFLLGSAGDRTIGH